MEQKAKELERVHDGSFHLDEHQQDFIMGKTLVIMPEEECDGKISFRSMLRCHQEILVQIHRWKYQDYDDYTFLFESETELIVLSFPDVYVFNHLHDFKNFEELKPQFDKYLKDEYKAPTTIVLRDQYEIQIRNDKNYPMLHACKAHYSVQSDTVDITKYPGHYFLQRPTKDEILPCAVQVFEPTNENTGKFIFDDNTRQYTIDGLNALFYVFDHVVKAFVALRGNSVYVITVNGTKLYHAIKFNHDLFGKKKLYVKEFQGTIFLEIMDDTTKETQFYSINYSLPEIKKELLIVEDLF